MEMLQLDANFGNLIMEMSPVTGLPPLSYHSLLESSTGNMIFGGDSRHASTAREDGQHKGESVSNALYLYQDTGKTWGVMEVPGIKPGSEFWGTGLTLVGGTTMLIFAGLSDMHAHAMLWTLDVASSSWSMLTYSVLSVGSNDTTAAVASCSSVQQCPPLSRYGHSSVSMPPASSPYLANAAVMYGGITEDRLLPFDDVYIVQLSSSSSFSNMGMVVGPLRVESSSTPGGLYFHAAAVDGNNVIKLLLPPWSLRRGQNSPLPFSSPSSTFPTSSHSLHPSSL